MSILSTNHRLISIGESYSAGSGIDITDQVISVTGDVMPYSAGENIDIQGHVISGKDWSQEITDASSNAFNETTAWVHDNYANSADVSYLSGVVDNKLDASAWSTVSGDFATEDYVIIADNITYDRTTGYVENQQFAKESACQSAFEQLNTNKLDASSFTDWQNGQYSTDLQTIEGQIANKLDTSSFSEVSGDFQPRGDYVERNTVYSAIESATSGKLDVSSFASVSSDFLTTSFGISESATWNDVSETVQTNSAQWADGGSGDEEVNSFVYNNSATINEVNTAYQQYSASYQPSGNYIPYTANNITPNTYNTNSALTLESNRNILYLKPTLVEVTTGPMSVMKRTSIASGGITAQNRTTNDATFISPNSIVLSDGPANRNALIDCSSIDNWNEVSTTVQSNSAQWAEGGAGDEEVNELVHSNSGTWNTVTNKLDTTDFSTVSGDFLTAINIPESATWNEVSTTVQSNSAQWAGGGGSVPVSNSGDLYKVEFDGVDLYGYKKTTTIPNYAYTAMKSSTGNSVQAYNFPEFDNVGFSSNVSYFYNADIITFSSNGEGIYPSEDERYGTTALDVYYKASNLYDWYNNQFADFSGYIGKITLDNLVISSYLKKPSYFNKIFRCGNFDLWFSSNYGRDGFPIEYVLSLVDEALTGTSTFEGIFVPSALPTYEYDSTNKISAINGSAIAAGDEFPASADEAIQYVQTNSANIDDTVTSYQTNSGTFLTAHQSLADYIPYSASGVELTNSNFKIDTSGQAYKLGSVSGSMPLEFGEVMYGFPNGALTELENGVTYTLTIQGTQDNSMVMFVNLNTQSPYAERPTVTNNQCTFTWAHEDASVGILDQYGKIDSTSTTLTYTKTAEKRYALEDNFEYNAVGEISGYGSSAIAQYGAEKQWLVHDDTLCHLSNSAQYALGVNLSAISGLLLNLFGLDETTLWSGSNSTTSVMNFSEPYSSFKKLRFEYKDNNDISCEQTIPTENINTNIVLTSFWTNTANGSFLKPSLYQISSNGIQLNNGCEYSFSTSYSRAGTSNKLTMTKIYGIGRKS
jgi:hypothetical protein